MLYISDYSRLNTLVRTPEAFSWQERLSPLLHRQITVFTGTAAPFSGMLTGLFPDCLLLLANRPSFRKRPSSQHSKVLIPFEQVRAVVYKNI